MPKSGTSSWRIALPLLAVLLLTAAWCGYWLFARQFAQREFADLADRGLRIDCASEQWVGFPFRLTLLCGKPVFGFGNRGVAVSGSGERLAATARIYDPSHVIVELSGPSTITQTRPPDPAGRIYDKATIRSEATPIRAGLQLDLNGLRRLTLRLDGWSGTVDAGIGPKSLGSANLATDQLAIHWTFGKQTTDTQAYAVEAAGLTVTGTPARIMGLDRAVIARIELAAAVSKISALVDRGGSDMLKAWQSAGGEIALEHFALDMDDRHVAGTGTIRLDAEGRLDGTIDLTVKDLQRVFDEMIAQGRLKESQATLATTALRLLTKAAPEPQPGWSRVPVRLSRGRLYFGPLKVAEFAPLF